MRLHLDHLVVKWKIIASLIRISAGGTGQFLIGSGSWIFLTRIMADFGSAAQAGYGFAIRIIIFAIMPARGMANLCCHVGWTKSGCRKTRAGRKICLACSISKHGVYGYDCNTIFSFARRLIGFFTIDEVALKNGIECLQIVSLGYVFYAYGMVVNQAFNGAGDTRTPIIISFFGFWICQIPLAYFIAKILDVGPVGVYMAIAIAESLMAIAGIWIFRRGKWKTVKI